MTARPAGPLPTDVTLANPRAPRIRRVAALAGRSARRRTGTMLVEGPQAVTSSVLHASDRIVNLYLTHEVAQRHHAIVAAAHTAGVRIDLGTPQVLTAMSADAQGVVAVVTSASATLDELVDRSVRLVAVLHDVRDPGNAGTVIRTADAAGADGVILAGDSVDVANPKVIRASAGSVFHLPVITHVSLDDALTGLRGAGTRILATDGAGEVEVPGGSGLDLTAPTAWLFGNEAHGLAHADRSMADAVVRVPLYGRAESLNLASAAAVCLYASAHAQRSGSSHPGSP